MKREEIFLMIFLATAALFTGCSGDDDETPAIVDPSGSLLIRDQPVIQGKVIIADVDVSHDSWVIIYRSNAGAQGTEILGHMGIDAGSHEDVTVQLDNNANVTVGETLWAALHVDSNENGVLDWDGTMGADVAIRSGTAIVSEAFVAKMGNTLTVEDQPVIDNSITISMINLTKTGYVSIHKDTNGTPGDRIATSELLEVGDHLNLDITFEEFGEVNVGDVLWISLWVLDGLMEQPAIGNDGNAVMTSITITE